MQVKCPKCRFRYDITAPSGMTEIACVCPRCGLPFTYLMENAADERPERSPSGKDAAGGGATGDALAARAGTSTGTHAAGEMGSSTESPAGSPENLSWQRADARPDRPDGAYRPTVSGTFNKQNRKRRRPFRSCLFLFFVILLVLALAVRSCRKLAHTGRLDGPALTDYPPYYHHAKTHDAPDSQADADPFEETHPGKAPSWIQGTWTYETEYGVIKLTVNGKKITESIGGKTVSGTFRYENRRLVCDFGDPDNITFYRLDTDRQQIDAGDGMLMEKEP